MARWQIKKKIQSRPLRTLVDENFRTVLEFERYFAGIFTDFYQTVANF